MSESYCGINCSDCQMKTECRGCCESGGKPFGGTCVLAKCCKECNENECRERIAALKNKLIAEICALNIPDMPTVTELYSLKGEYINLEYKLPSGQKVKFWEEDRVYLGCQLERENSERCYGIVADENHILVCEYGCNGSEPEIILFKKR